MHSNEIYYYLKELSWFCSRFDLPQVQLNNRFYNAYVQEVSPDNGPVTVFIGELNKQYVFMFLCIGIFIDSTNCYF